MSLDQLRALRHAGKRPAMVSVVIGQPRELLDGPGVVVVTDPYADLRALIGLQVHVIDLRGHLPLTRRVIDALEAVSVRPLGICGPAGACGVSEDHEYAMQKYRESLS